MTETGDEHKKRVTNTAFKALRERNGHFSVMHLMMHRSRYNPAARDYSR
jgi:hypothetical protein